jgi:biopolymer transport protein TolR
MTVSASGMNTQKSEINVTPLIDVLLVLLIIFMVVAPTNPVGLHALVAQPPPPNSHESPNPQDIVITVKSADTVEINQDRVEMAALPERLARIFEARGDAVIFVRGEGSLTYGTVAHVIDVARGAGLDRVGLMTTS